jgi:hypothetical protein
MSLRASNPRTFRLSPAGWPPSPAAIVIPGTFVRTSRRDVAPCCSISTLGTIEIVCGMSRSGSEYFAEEGAAAKGEAVTSMEVDDGISRRISPGAVLRNAIPVSLSRNVRASSRVRAPSTPGDARSAIAGGFSRKLAPVICSRWAMTSPRGPGVMSRSNT